MNEAVSPQWSAVLGSVATVAVGALAYAVKHLAARRGVNGNGRSLAMTLDQYRSEVSKVAGPVVEAVEACRDHIREQNERSAVATSILKGILEEQRSQGHTLDGVHVGVERLLDRLPTRS